jgi:TetR/AcrR family fatty acid metabolism transcriptional regulator
MTQARTNSTDKREAILKAATEVFARNGYFSSKVSDIAKAAGVADGTVYLYFKSKEEILHSIFDRTMAEGIEQAKIELAKCRTPQEKLRCLSKLHLARLGADRDLAIVFQIELRGSTKFMEEFSAAGFGEYLRLIHAIFEEGQASGAFRKDLHAKTCAKILYGALDEMATNWILSEKGYELAPMSDSVLDVFFNGVASKK